MLRASDYDLRKAAQIKVVRTKVEDYLAATVYEGQPLHIVAEVRYYYLGLKGNEAEEEITEANFLGDDEEVPRQPGYYAVDIVTPDGKSVLPKPWFAVFRDQSRDMNERRDRDKTIEGNYGDITEEWRLIADRHKRELLDQIRRNTALQNELNTFTVAYSNMRKALGGVEIERDKAVQAAAEMEYRMGLAIERCNELESEASSFKPQIKALVDGFVEKVGPEAQRMFHEIGGFGGEDGEEGTAKKKPPKPPWSGGGGGAASQPNNGASKSSNGAANGAYANGTHEEQPANGANSANGAAEEEPDFREDGIPGPRFLTKSLNWLLWEMEPFGKFVCLEQKAEDGVSPLCPWWVIRGVAYYHSGLDLGPDPIWPSEVSDAPGESAKTPSNASAKVEFNGEKKANGRAKRPAAADAAKDAPIDAAGVEIVPEGDSAGDDAMEASSDDSDDSDGPDGPPSDRPSGSSDQDREGVGG